jgi:hypothetical protein
LSNLARRSSLASEHGRGGRRDETRRDLVEHDLEEPEPAREPAVGPLHEEVRDSAVRHPHLDHGPVVVPQELRRPVLFFQRKILSRRSSKNKSFPPLTPSQASKASGKSDSQRIGVLDVGLEGLDGVLELAHRPAAEELMTNRLCVRAEEPLA